MKLQDVILKAMAKQLTRIEGYSGLFDQRRGKRSYHRVPMEAVEHGHAAERRCG